MTFFNKKSIITLLIFITFFLILLLDWNPDQRKEINKETIIESISLSQNWYANNINTETNLLEYIYYPSYDYSQTYNNHLRQLATLWVLTEMKLFLENNSTDLLINNTFNYYLGFKNNSNGHIYLTIDDNSVLACNAFMIMAILNIPDYPERDILMEQLADGILAMQNEDGSYNMYLNAGNNIGIDYYPGEAMLALMKLYQSTEDGRYLDSVKKAFPYYRSYWRNNKNSIFIPWQTQAYRLLYQETGNVESAGFVFEMNDWLIDNYQSIGSGSPENMGGFPRNNPDIFTSFYLEGINDAYSVAKSVNDSVRVNKYANSIKNGTSFILQLQLTKMERNYPKNPARAKGGFKYSFTIDEQRIDYTLHAVRSLIKTYENKIFD
jgi:hypothetical protein